MMSDNLLLNESGSFDGFLSEENSNTLSELEDGDKAHEAIAPLNEPLEVDDPSLNYNLEETETQLKQAVDQITAETNFILGSDSDNLQSLETDEVKSDSLITDPDTLVGNKIIWGEHDSLTGAEETTELEEPSLLETHPSSETSTTSSDSSLEEFLDYQSGFFTVIEPSGQVTIDYLFDGGGYGNGELAIFSLAGLKPNQLSWAELVKEATRRALSNSEEGYVVLSDSQEGARFSGELGEPDYNRGEYLGVKTFQMRPGDTFGVMLVPNASVDELFDNPELGGYKKPIFSMSLENPHNIEQFSQVVDMNVFQMADVLGDGHTFALEDIRIVNNNSDQDYNDIIFQVRGAKADAIHLDRLLEGGLLKQDWRDLELGQSLVNYAEFAVAAANDLLEDPLTPDLSDPVKYGVERAENLDNYDPELLAAQTEWVIWFAPNPYIEVSQIATLLGADVVKATGQIEHTYIWKFPEAITPQQVQQRLADLVGGDFAYPLVPIELKKPQFIPDESLLKDQWHLPDTSEVNGNTSEGANAINAWNWSTGKGVVIAIVDDGVQQDHPDLIERFKYAAENGLNLDLNDIEDTGEDPSFANVETTFATSDRIQFSDGPVESIQDLFGLSNRLRWMNEELSWTELFGMSNRIRWSDEGELSWNELFGLSNRIRWSDEPEQFLEGLFGLSNRIRWADGSEMNLEELFGLSNRLRWAEDAGLLQQDFAGLGENRTLIWKDGEEKGSEVSLEELFGLSNRIRWSDNTEQFLEQLFGLSNRIRWSDNTEVTLEQLFGLSNRIRWSEDPQLLLEDLFGLSNRIRWSDEALEANWDDIFNQANSLQNVSDPEEFLTALFGEGDWIQWEDGTAISIDELFGLSNRIRWSSEPELFWDSLFGMSNRIRWSEDPVLFWDTLFGMSNRVRWMEDSQLSWDWTELFGLSNRIRWSEDAGFFLEDLFGLSNRIRWSDDRPVDWSELVSNIHEILAAEPGDRTELWQQWYGGENALIWSGDNVPVSWQELGAVVTDIDWSETLDESWSWKQLFGLSNRIRWSEDAPPPPYHPPGMHGTAVAGVAGAAGTQHGGVSGGAPDANLAAIRLTADKVTDEKIATAISHAYHGIDIYNNSWKPADNFVSPALSLAALENNALKGRDGLGNVIIFAAGNDGWDGGNVNYNPFANSRYVIPVAAIDYQGQQSWYSEPGASLLVSASSSSAYRDGTSVGITTTDLVGEQGYSDGNYTDRFGGTSSAAPLVSGIVALMLEANPNLTWRDVQHILVETTQKNDPNHSDWVQNGAGLWVNHSYGFGAVDATIATQAAMNWEFVQPEIAITSGAIDILGRDADGNIEHTIQDRLPKNNTTGVEIPDFDATGITDSVTIFEDIKIEKIEIVFDAKGLYRGDLEIVLIAPDGTESVLAQPRFDDGTGYENWVFTSARHWGESSLGEWQLQVRDLMSGDVGTWNGWKLNFYGTENDAATVSVTATDTDATEDGNAGQLVFTRDGGDISKALMAQYSIAGTATNGTDYQELTGTVIFEPGQTKVTIGVVPFHDYELEGNETVEITLIDGIGYSLGTEISDTVTIENSTIIDRYGSFVYVNPANGHLYLLSAPDTWLGAQNQAEALGGNLVSINTAEEQQWIVDTFGTSQVFHIGLTDSEMYGNKEGDFKWVNGDPITYINWKEGEPNNTPFLPEGEDFSVINQHVDGKWNDRTYIGNFPGIIEIDPAQLDQTIVNIMVTDSLAGEEGNAGQIVIQRIGNLDQSLSVNYSLGGDATNGSDLQTLSGNIIIPAGETLVTLPIIALPDDEIEANETLVINLTEGDYEIGTQPSGHIIITDQNPINRIANEVIGRDVSLFDEWMERWQNGETLEQLRPAIIQSATDGQGNNEAELKIAEFYQELLGREAETTEIDYWRNQLETDATLSQVRQGIEGADFIDTTSYVYTNPVTGNRYFLTTPDTWLGAQEQAQALGGNLVTIDDADENQWLVDTFGSGRMWIGLNDSPIYGNTEGNHQWVSGEVTYTNWLPPEPNNASSATPEGEDFSMINYAVSTYGTAGWNDVRHNRNLLSGIVEIPNPESSNPLNNPPVVTTTNVALTGATENAGFTVTHADLVAATGATDIDGDPLTFRIQTVGSDIPTKNGQPVEAGVTTLSAGEAIVWTPTTVGNAQPAFTATLTDGKVTVATPVTVSIDVNPVTVSIEATDPDATEGSDPGEFTFTRTGDTSNPMTVNFTIEPSIHWSRPQARNGTDYETIPTSIIIPEGETSITLTITSLEDTEAEWPETVRLKVAEGEGYEINSTENLDTVVIWDNETPQLQLMGEWYSGQPTNFHRESYTSESRNDEHFLLRRIGSVEEDLTVYYSLPGTATNGEDYEELPGSIIIPAGQHSVSFTFIPIDDSEVEGDETVEVTLTPDPTYTFMNHQGRIWDRIPLTLVDNDDKPTVEITVSDNQASEYGDPGQFTISRTGDTSNPLTVDYWISTGWWHKAKNGIDYEAIPESITIPAGESSITIDINPIDDSELEEDEIVDIYLKSNPNYAMRGTYYAKLKILDNETQSLQSQQQFGTSAEDVANSIAADSAGNTYTVGHTSGDLGGTNAGGSDGFIVKRDSSGNELWQIQLGTADDDEAKQIAVDSADNLYVLGWSGDPSNSWIAKYDSNGTQQWQKPLGIAGYDITNGALTIGNDGSLYVTGRTTGDLDGTNQGATDTWVAKYDSDGFQTWVKQLGSIDEDEALGIAVDNNSNVYITGETKGSLAGTREGDGDAWVAQLDSSGNLQWQTQLGTTAVDIARSVAVDNNGHVYLGGQTFGWLGETYSGSANHWVGDRDAWWKGIHGDRSGLGGTYYGNGDAWVAQLDSATGTINWKRLIGTPEADTTTKVVADSLGNVYLTGTTQGKIGETEYGGEDIFLAKYNLNGALQWKKQVGSEGDDIVNDLILDITGLYLTGKTTGNLKGSNLGENDAWVMTFS